MKKRTAQPQRRCQLCDQVGPCNSSYRLPAPAQSEIWFLIFRGCVPRLLFSASGKPAFFDEFLSHGDHVGMIEREDDDGCATDGSSPEENRAVPAEMAFPFVAPRMKKWRSLLRFRINAPDVGALVAVAVETGESKVRQSSRAKVLLGNDVIDGERLCRIRPLGKAAVLTSITRTVRTIWARRLFIVWRQETFFLASVRLALDWSAASKCPARTKPNSSSRSSAERTPS
ncbi:MAG: hypothetical protein U0793_17595 [Gemmataceae bacterium]